MKSRILSIQWILMEKKATYHGWPTLCKVGKDHLCVVCSGHRKHHVCPFGRVYLYESFDGGNTWSTPKQLTNGPLDDRDAGMIEAPDGSWLVNYFTSIAFATYADRTKGPSPWAKEERSISLADLYREHGLKLLRSSDQGKTWTRIEVPVNNVHGPCVLKDGSLLWAGKVRTSAVSESCMTEGVAVFRSTDNGLTWEKYSELPEGKDSVQKKWYELYQLQTKDGRILVQIRDHSKKLHSGICTVQCESTDGGKTWSKPKYICAGFPSHLLNLRSGKVLMSYGWRGEGGYGIRYKVGESTPKGMIWGREKILTSDGDTADLGYSSTAELDDGTLVTVWYQYRKDANLASLRMAKWRIEE